MKQTAIDWLIDVLSKNFGIAISDNIIEQAKELEKQQVIEAFNEGALDGLQLGEQYYNFVFKKWHATNTLNTQQLTQAV